MTKKRIKSSHLRSQNDSIFVISAWKMNKTINKIMTYEIFTD